MKKITLIPYFSTWSLYIIFSLSAFPFLKITVMLFSIPLTMLGGWLFRYKGALITTFLTIPYHYFMLHHHTDAPEVLLEAFNPFGIGTQLCFSLGTALLKSTQLRYQKLNTSLETIVQERTKDLTQLTDHLIEIKEEQFSLTTTGLLNEPLGILNDMAVTSKQLALQLKNINHQGHREAETIEDLIRLCIQQLNSIDHETAPLSQNTSTRDGPNKKLIQQFDALSGSKTNIHVEGNWSMIGHETLQDIHPIIHEAVTNALRHASPTQISINIENDPSVFIVSIENDGKPMPSGSNDGMGISLMQYRARRMGASISFDTKTPHKTRVVCSIPRNSE
jgi:glucose-6-phosphate-specific signal transduction histidine kinase